MIVLSDKSEGSVLVGLVGKVLAERWWPGDPATAPSVSTPYDAF